MGGTSLTRGTFRFMEIGRKTSSAFFGNHIRDGESLSAAGHVEFLFFVRYVLLFGEAWESAVRA